MNEQEKIQLQKMIQANDTEDHTEVIRRVKHSGEITTDVLSMLKIKKDYPMMKMLLIIYQYLQIPMLKFQMVMMIP